MKFHDLNSRCFWVLEKVRMDKKCKNYHWYPKKTYEIAKSWEEKALSFWISSWLENLSCKLINFLELLLLNQNPLQGFQFTLVKSTKSSFFTLVQLHICKKLQSKFYPFRAMQKNLCRFATTIFRVRIQNTRSIAMSTVNGFVGNILTNWSDIRQIVRVTQASISQKIKLLRQSPF